MTREPSAVSFVLKIHLQPTREASCGSGVKVLVLFERRFFTHGQTGEAITSLREVGIRGRETIEA